MPPRGEDGTLHVRKWEPAVPPKAQIVLIHGYGEHGGRYEELAGALVQRGFAVLAPDLPGHGASSGRRGEVTSFDGLVEVVSAFVEQVRARRPDLRLGIFAHSFGGALAAASCSGRANAVDALVLSAPYLRHGRPVPPWLRAAVAPLAGLFPRLGLDRVDPRDLSRIPSQVRAYEEDPLVYHGKATALTVRELFRGFSALDRAAEIEVPLLVVQGTHDRIAHPSGAEDLVARAAGRDAALELVEGGYHELLNDLAAERVRTLVVDWLDSRLCR